MPIDGSHPYIPPGPTDRRAPCPAMNSLANHGYLPRDGRNLTRAQLGRAIREVFHVSYPISIIFGILAVVLCGRWSGLKRVVDLDQLAAHNVVEHDGSLLHPDAPAADSKFAPTDVDHDLLSELLSNNKEDANLTLRDLCAWQLRRIGAARKLDKIHALFAHAEVVLLHTAMGVPHDDGSERSEDGNPDNSGGSAEERVVVPKKFIKQWFGEGRLPDGWTGSWRPIDHTALSQGIKEVGKIQASILQTQTSSPTGSIV